MTDQVCTCYNDGMVDDPNGAYTLTGEDRYSPCPECNPTGKVPAIYRALREGEPAPPQVPSYVVLTAYDPTRAPGHSYVLYFARTEWESREAMLRDIARKGDISGENLVLPVYGGNREAWGAWQAIRALADLAAAHPTQALTTLRDLRRIGTG